MAIILDKIKALFSKNQKNTLTENKTEDMVDGYAIPDNNINESSLVSQKLNDKEHEHANYVNEIMEKFNSAKKSGASREMVENIGHQVIVAMQKESIEKARELKANNSENYVKGVKEFNEKQQELINKFKSDNGLDNEKQNDLDSNENYLQKIIYNDKEKGQRNI